MGTENHKDDRNSPEYLSQLLKDKKQIQAFPSVFVHLERLLDEEITRTRSHLFHFGNQKESLSLPEPQGPIVTLSEKLYVPVKDHPEFNFVGRILGPRGMTAKQLELDTGCKIMVRGKGSMRDKKKEDVNRGKPNWEHLNEELHVLITVEDTRNRSEIKLSRATEEVKRLLVPAPEGEDELKKMQLLELAIINGTYRQGEQLQLAQAAANAAKLQSLAQGQRLYQPAGLPFGFSALTGGLRSPGPAGAPIFLTPRLPSITSPSQLTQLTTSGNAPQYLTSQFVNGGPPPLISPTDSSGGLYIASYPSMQDPYAALASPQLFDYSGSGLEQTAAGAAPKVHRTVGAVGSRDHPYMRVSLA